MTTGFPTSQAIFRAYACNFRFLGFFLKRKCQKSNYKNSWLFGKARSSWEQAVLFLPFKTTDSCKLASNREDQYKGLSPAESEANASGSGYRNTDEPNFPDFYVRTMSQKISLAPERIYLFTAIACSKRSFASLSPSQASEKNTR